MINIRKEFKYEMGHIVRNAFSQRCAKTPHGHSYRVEFVLSGTKPDAGQMVMDFGFIKQFLGPFVDSFDHSFWLWDRPEDTHVVKFFKENFERIITTPFSTSAEVQAKLFFVFAEAVVKKLSVTNPEYPEINVVAVRVHETATGFAEYTKGDDSFPNIRIEDISFADGVKKDWSDNFRKFYESICTPKQTTYLEISARQCGKTSRLVSRAIEHSKVGDVVIYTNRHSDSKSLHRGLHKQFDSNYTIFICPISSHNRLNGLRNPLYMYDECDFMVFPEGHVFEDNVYVATTPASLRLGVIEKSDKLYPLLKRTAGVFHYISKPYGVFPRYTITEHGRFYETSDGKLLPHPSLNPQQDKLSTMKIHVD